MPCARCLVRVIGRLHTFAQEAAAVVGAVVLDAAPGDFRFEVRRQRLPGRRHAADPRIATRRRNLQRIEHGCVGRQIEIAHVRVPDRLAGTERTHRLALVVEHVGDDVDVRVAHRAQPPVLLVGRWIELPEAPAEAQQVIIRELLVAKQQGAVAVPGLLDRSEIGVAQSGQMDARDLGANGRSYRFRPLPASFALPDTRCIHPPGALALRIPIFGILVPQKAPRQKSADGSTAQRLRWPA